MKKLLVVLGLLVVLSSVALGQISNDGLYYVLYYSNNSGPVPGAFDQTVRIINDGVTPTPIGGTPLSGTGDMCANIYVFDNNQEMIACCVQRLTPNELGSASVGRELTANPVTSVVPTAGVIKIVLSFPAGLPCNPTSFINPSSNRGAVFTTHLQATGGGTFLTETEQFASPLAGEEASFLQLSCSFARYLGSGKGVCTSTVPGL